MTHAERDLNYWQTLHTISVNVKSVKEPLARVVVDAIGGYQPFDFMPGSTWELTQINWQAAPKCTCRSLALAALIDVQHAIQEYRA